MTVLKKNLFILITLSLILSCRTGGVREASNRNSRELDNLILQITENIIPLLPAEDESNIAVYYFTSDGEESPYSDYLINNLTTEIANRAPANCRIVSRQGLDRIMDEYSFQLTDLVSEETQIDIGELLGADTIITGYITSLGDRNTINIQLIDVLSGTVSGGFSLDFSTDLYLGGKPDNDIVTLGRQYIEQSGLSTTTIIYENFDGPIAEITPGFFEEHWGNRIISVSGETDIDPEGFAYLDFSAEVDSSDYIQIREDSDFTYYMDLPLNEVTDLSDGLYFKIKPLDFSLIYVIARQTFDEETNVLGIPVSLKEGEWNTLRIPFSNLKLFDGEDRLDEDEPVSLTLGIPYIGNLLQGYFTGDFIKGRLEVDELGLFEFKESRENNGIISSFEDEILKVVPSVHTEGAFFYNGKLNKSINSLSQNWSLIEDGPVGSFFSLNAEYELNDEIQLFLNDYGELSLVLDLYFTEQRDGREKLSFLISTEGVTNGYLHVSDPQEEEAFDSEFRSGKSWSRITINCDDLIYEEESSGYDWDDPLLMRLIWPISPALLKKAADDEKPLILTVNIDELKWE